MNEVRDLAIEVVLKHEGGFSNHESDPGGATNFGVSLRTLRQSFIKDPVLFADFDLDGDGEILEADIYNLTETIAKEYYCSFWWEKFKFDYIPIKKMAIKVFDVSVNIGPRRAIKHYQDSLNSVAPSSKLIEDGILGPKTQKISQEILKNDEKLTNLYAIFILNVELFYRDLIHKSPTLKAFLKGWLNRLYDNEHFEQDTRDCGR